ncbi:MAG: hypothetical protein MUO77_16065, partial [Anaerolineales bacterium]|nr:hypothetical protein [Anaerolineales bacterium]
KDLAQVILESDKGDPILATWQYGLGRSVAFTSDATGRWARDWARSKIFPTFWAQAVRYTINDSLNTALQMTIESQGEKANIILDARDRAGNFINSYQIKANIVAPNGEMQTVTFTQVAPGRYESEFIPKQQGIYLIRFSGKTDAGSESASFAETTGWALSYSPEYQRIESDPDLLLRLSALAGGQIASPLPSAAFSHNLRATRASRPIAPLLLLIAALILPIDIAARRLIITRHDLLLLREWIAQRLPTRQTKQPQLAQSPQMTALFNAKSRVRESTSALPKEHRDDVSEAEAPSAVETESTPSPEKEAQRIPPKPEQTSSTTSALLARKKNLRK